MEVRCRFYLELVEKPFYVDNSTFLLARHFRRNSVDVDVFERVGHFGMKC